MTAFDPKKALEILQRRYRYLEDEGTKIGGQVYARLWRGFPSHHRIVRELESQRDAAYERADKVRPLLRYLEQRIEEEKSPGEIIWDHVQHWPYRDGPGMVEDILRAAHQLDIDPATV